MTPDSAMRLLDLYGQVREALDRDDTGMAESLMGDIDAALAEPARAEDEPALRALAIQVDAARRDGEVALQLARERLLRQAQAEMHTGSEGSRAYGAGLPVEARFIDRTG